MPRNFLKEDLFVRLFLFISKAERESSFTRRAQQPGLGQAEAGSLELLWVSPWEAGPSLAASQLAG